MPWLLVGERVSGGFTARVYLTCIKLENFDEGDSLRDINTAELIFYQSPWII